MTASKYDTVLVVDFGAQYAQLIARRIRENRVHSEIVPNSITLKEIRARRPVGIILSGGPSSVYLDHAPSLQDEILRSDIPLLGICYGAQLIARGLGGRVERTERSEFGGRLLKIAGFSPLFRDVPTAINVWMSHSDSIVEVPNGFDVSASTETMPIAAFESPEKGIYAVQFHPEVVHTERGSDILKNFLFEICQARPSWTPVSIIETSVNAIREQVGNERVLCGLSGGVDSAVAAALTHKAIGKQLTCIFVDTGLMRQGEAEQIEEAFRRRFDVEPIHVKADEDFFAALKGKEDPEKKRKAIGKTFIDVFQRHAGKLDDARFLVQGTLYPDVIESGTHIADKIKTHHNVGGLPKNMRLKLIEPLRELFKDEVRTIGQELGLPEEIVLRQPFPGPGLAVRILGQVTRDNVAILQAVDAIVTQEFKRAGVYKDLWQSFPILLANVKTVGVMGDSRTYAHPVVIRAVKSEDAMTADWAWFERDVLDKLSQRIVNEVVGVNRVVLDITSKPPGTIEWE